MPDASSFKDCAVIVQKYGIESKCGLPSLARLLLPVYLLICACIVHIGCRQQCWSTCAAGSPMPASRHPRAHRWVSVALPIEWRVLLVQLPKVQNLIVGSNSIAVAAAAAKAES